MFSVTLEKMSNNVAVFFFFTLYQVFPKRNALFDAFKQFKVKHENDSLKPCRILYIKRMYESALQVNEL